MIPQEEIDRVYRLLGRNEKSICVESTDDNQIRFTCDGKVLSPIYVLGELINGNYKLHVAEMLDIEPGVSYRPLAFPPTGIHDGLYFATKDLPELPVKHLIVLQPQE